MTTPRRPWTTYEAALALVLTVGCVGITVPAFIEIYRTVTAVVHPWFGHWDWVVPVCGEIAWVVAFGAGVLLTLRSVTGGSLRWALQAVLVVLSIGLNVYAAKSNAADTAGHLVVVVAFFGTLAVAKGTIARIMHAQTAPDRIVVAEWLTHPAQSFKLWRHMTAWGEPSKHAARVRYSALLYAVALAQADPRIGRGVGWRRRMPVTLRYQVRTGIWPPSVEASINGPAAVPGGWQEPVSSHVSRELRLLDPAAVPNPPGKAPANGSESASESGSGKALRKPSQAAVRKMSGADLAPYVGALLGSDPPPSKQRVMDSFRVGAPKAAEALRALASPPPHAAVITLSKTGRGKAPAGRHREPRNTARGSARG